jgi:hypothetical protein
VRHQPRLQLWGPRPPVGDVGYEIVSEKDEVVAYVVTVDGRRTDVGGVALRRNLAAHTKFVMDKVRERRQLFKFTDVEPDGRD